MPLTVPLRPSDPLNTNYPPSGYTADRPRGGPWVCNLEAEWARRMEVKHAIACNSATSGLLAAASVCGPEWSHTDIAVPCFTMSATAAATSLANPHNSLYWMDCDYETYCSTPVNCPVDHIGLIVVTDLFGQCAPLEQWRGFADNLGCYLIEDASQAPFATTPDGSLAGTIGDVGVFSLNIHKHLQCGEGGVIVTNDDDLANKLRGFVNHGEARGQDRLGLNLRMLESSAQIALSRLRQADSLIGERVEIARELSEMVKDFWTPPVEQGRHVYYIWAVRVPNRNKVVEFLNNEGIPVRAGYVSPLYRLPAFSDWTDGTCPVAEKANDELMIFEVCCWNPTKEQLKEMKEIFKRASDIGNLHQT